MNLRTQPTLLAAIRSSVLAILLLAPGASAQDAQVADPALRSYISANGLLSRGMYELAEKDYREFLAANPDHAKAMTARYGLGVCLFREKQFDQAAKELAGPAGAKGFEFAPESRLIIAQCELAQGRYSPAASAIDRLLRDFPEHACAADAAALLVEARYR